MKIYIALMMIATAIAQCPDKDQYCGQCNGTTCTTCYASYLNIVSGICVKPTTTVDNCSSYLTNGVCASCLDGYYWTLDLKCTKDNSNCMRNTILGCISCGNYIKLVSGACNSANKCTDANCVFCSGTDTCYTCKSGFSLGIDGKCTAATTTIVNCATIVANSCAGCNFGYYSLNGVCTLSTAYKTAQILVSAFFAFFGAMLI